MWGIHNFLVLLVDLQFSTTFAMITHHPPGFPRVLLPGRDDATLSFPSGVVPEVLVELVSEVLKEGSGVNLELVRHDQPVVLGQGVQGERVDHLEQLRPALVTALEEGHEVGRPDNPVLPVIATRLVDVLVVDRDEGGVRVPGLRLALLERVHAARHELDGPVNGHHHFGQLVHDVLAVRPLGSVQVHGLNRRVLMGLAVQGRRLALVLGVRVVLLEVDVRDLRLRPLAWQPHGRRGRLRRFRGRALPGGILLPLRHLLLVLRDARRLWVARRVPACLRGIRLVGRLRRRGLGVHVRRRCSGGCRLWRRWCRWLLVAWPTVATAGRTGR